VTELQQSVSAGSQPASSGHLVKKRQQSRSQPIADGLLVKCETGHLRALHSTQFVRSTLKPVINAKTRCELGIVLSTSLEFTSRPFGPTLRMIWSDTVTDMIRGVGATRLSHSGGNRSWQRLAF
ncbi:hypothetical protein AVEN_92033-1, partial [Araneus ventricosus]